MLPDIGATELMVIALVALIFVGPKDLPVMLRKLGEFTAKMRRMAADFRTSFDDMARQSELEDLRREVEQMRAKATEAITDPIGVQSTFRETIQDVDAAMTGTDSYDYETGVAAPENPAITAAPPPKKRAPRKASVTPGESAAKPRRSKAAPKTSSTGAAEETVAKPRRRAAKAIS